MGGWSPVPGSTTMNDWRWYYSNDFNGPSTPLAYYMWVSEQPNNYNGIQHALVLHGSHDYDFNDIRMDKAFSSYCFLCECP